MPRGQPERAIFPTQSVTGGLFTTELDFGAEAFDNTGCWLEIYVNSSLLAPRQPITRSPYSIQTRGIFVDANNNVGIGTTTPADRLHIRGDFPSIRLQDNLATSSYSEITDGGTAQLRIDKTNSSGEVYLDLNPKPVDGTSDATVRFFRDTNSTGNKAVQFLRGNSSSEISAQIGVDGEDSYFQLNGGDVGIGISTPGSTLHVVDTGSNGGIYAQTTDGSNAIYGSNLKTVGFSSGVTGYAAGSSSAGVYALADGDDAYAMFGWAYTDATYGVYGQCDNTSGYGVYGHTRTSTGVNYGVYGRADSITGRGTYGYASHATGVNYGVVGRSSSPNSFDFFASGASTNYGVYYDWDEEHGGSHDVGMIAEEVGAVLPEIVQYEDNGIDAIGLDYSKMTPLLVEAVNALRAEKDTEVAELRERIAELERLIMSIAAEEQTGIASRLIEEDK